MMITAGSGEVLDVVGPTFLQNGNTVLGSDPSYGSVYQKFLSPGVDADARRSGLDECPRRIYVHAWDSDAGVTATRAAAGSRTPPTCWRLEPRSRS